MELESTKLSLESLPRSVTHPLSELTRRESWRRARTQIETNNSKSNITRFYPRRKWVVFTTFLKLFGLLVWITGFYRLGKRRAHALKLTSLELEIPSLTRDFDGFEILHLSDIHFDRMESISKKIADLMKNRKPDLIVMTGDYKDNMRRPAELFSHEFEFLSKNLKSRYGIYAILGNHDSADMVPVIERHGINVLINQSVEINNGQSSFALTGVDDVHYFFTPEAIAALDSAPNLPVKILLVHSPEMVKEAAERNYSLYLCGHTHGGQVALPNGRAIVTHLNTGKEFSSGKWRQGKLQGYTSSGCGVSGLTIRFNTQSEVTLIKLRSPTF